MLCPIRVYKTGKSGGSRELANCARKAHGFVCVTYKELCNPRETKFKDVFGLCQDHFRTMMDPGSWARGWTKHGWTNEGGYFGSQGVVHDLRGLVETIEACERPLNPKEEKILRQLDSHKANIKRMMGQANAKEITLDMWREAFEDILQDMLVKEVMDA